MVVEDVDIKLLGTAKLVDTVDMEPGENGAYVKTQIVKAMGFREDTTNKGELSLVDLYQPNTVSGINKLVHDTGEYD